MLKRVYINTTNMRKNLQDGGNRPVIGVEEVLSDGSSMKLFDCMGVEIEGTCSIVFRPEQPAAGGASVVYVETFAPVRAR